MGRARVQRPPPPGSSATRRSCWRCTRARGPATPPRTAVHPTHAGVIPLSTRRASRLEGPLPGLHTFSIARACTDTALAALTPPPRASSRMRHRTQGERRASAPHGSGPRAYRSGLGHARCPCTTAAATPRAAWLLTAAWPSPPTTSLWGSCQGDGGGGHRYVFRRAVASACVPCSSMRIHSKPRACAQLDCNQDGVAGELPGV